jgi:hypothetical protein
VFEEAPPNVQLVLQDVANESALWCIIVGAFALNERFFGS